VRRHFALGLIGGTIEFDETLEDALRREVREETGLEVRAFSLFGTFSDPSRSAAYADGNVQQPVSIAYLVEVDDAAPVRPSRESLELRFFGRDELPLAELAETHVPIVQRYLDKASPPYLD
jgi:ADP-ribose pyrophosphatase YjhB (NUDIX family)